MSFLHLLILALIQGITEFLPISSSAHLILFPQLTGLADQGVAIDVSVHVGTLAAVMLYFRADVAMVLRGLPDLIRGRIDSPGARMAFLLLIATIPVMALGLVLKETGMMERMRSMAVTGSTRSITATAPMALPSIWPQVPAQLAMLLATRSPISRMCAARSMTTRSSAMMAITRSMVRAVMTA